MTIDRVGNTPKLARIVRFTNTQYQFADGLSSSDRDDLYSVRVNRTSSLNLVLSRLATNTNANIELYKVKGDKSAMLQRIGTIPFSNLSATTRNRYFALTRRSANPGNQNERFTAQLGQGDYYLRVRWVKGTTPYRLNLKLTPTPVPLAPFSQAWIRQINGEAGGNDYGYGITLDSSNNVLISGVSEDAAGNTRGSFIGKYLNADGSQAWFRQPTISGSDIAFDVAVDSAGDYYAGGIHNIGSALTNNPQNDAFFAKYNGSGSQEGSESWPLKSFTTKSTFLFQQRDAAESVSSVKIYKDANGNQFVYTAGFSNIFPTVTAGQAFIAKYDLNGNPVASFNSGNRLEFGGNNSDAVTSMAIDASGNVYVTGITNATVPLNFDINNPFTGGDAFVSKYNANGGLVWSETLATPASDYGRGIAVDSLGNVYVTGDTNGSLGGANAGGTDGFVAKFSQSADGSTATQQWVKQFGTAGTDQFQGIAINGNNQVFLAGETNQSLFGNTPLGGSDGFVAQISGTGTILRSKLIGTAADDEAYRLVANNSAVYLVGQTKGSIQTGITAQAYDAWVAKYNIV